MSLTYGTNTQGDQGAYIYDIWNPERGLGPDAHTTLDVTTGTDLFCSAQGDGAGYQSDDYYRWRRNYRRGAGTTPQPMLTFLDTGSYAINKSPIQMLKGRWYNTITTLPNGELLLQGRALRSRPRTVRTATRGLQRRERLAHPTRRREPRRLRSLLLSLEFRYGLKAMSFSPMAAPKMWRLDPSDQGDLTPLGVRPDNLVRQAGSAVLYDEGQGADKRWV